MLEGTHPIPPDGKTPPLSWLWPFLYHLRSLKAKLRFPGFCNSTLQAFSHAKPQTIVSCVEHGILMHSIQNDIHSEHLTLGNYLANERSMRGTPLSNHAVAGPCQSRQPNEASGLEKTSASTSTPSSIISSSIRVSPSSSSPAWPILCFSRADNFPTSHCSDRLAPSHSPSPFPFARPPATTRPSGPTSLMLGSVKQRDRRTIRLFNDFANSPLDDRASLHFLSDDDDDDERPLPPIPSSQSLDNLPVHQVAENGSCVQIHSMQSNEDRSSPTSSTISALLSPRYKIKYTISVPANEEKYHFQRARGAAFIAEKLKNYDLQFPWPPGKENTPAIDLLIRCLLPFSWMKDRENNTNYYRYLIYVTMRSEVAQLATNWLNQRDKLWARCCYP